MYIQPSRPKWSGSEHTISLSELDDLVIRQTGLDVYGLQDFTTYGTGENPVYYSGLWICEQVIDRYCHMVKLNKTLTSLIRWLKNTCLWPRVLVLVRAQWMFIANDF